MSRASLVTTCGSGSSSTSGHWTAATSTATCGRADRSPWTSRCSRSPTGSRRAGARPTRRSASTSRSPASSSPTRSRGTPTGRPRRWCAATSLARELDRPPGPWLADALDGLGEAQYRGDVMTREQALAWAREEFSSPPADECTPSTTVTASPDRGVVDVVGRVTRPVVVRRGAQLVDGPEHHRPVAGVVGDLGVGGEREAVVRLDVDPVRAGGLDRVPPQRAGRSRTAAGSPRRSGHRASGEPTLSTAITQLASRGSVAEVPAPPRGHALGERLLGAHGDEQDSQPAHRAARAGAARGPSRTATPVRLSFAPGTAGRRPMSAMPRMRARR